MVRQVQLLWHTMRYLRSSQILARLRLRGQATVRRVAPRAAQLRYRRLAERSGLLPPQALWNERSERLGRELTSVDDWTRSARRADAALSGRFAFLNAEARLGRPVAWDAPGQSQLWRYHLHYCGYLLDLVATRQEAWPDIESLIADWTAACPLGESHDAWHPFVVSERLVNWLFAIQLGAPSVEAVPEEIWRSLAVQTIFVGRNLEADVGGNHLLKNLKAMSVASCVWRGAAADRLRGRYVAAFDRELARQLLTDGCHYERSPMYHGLVLADTIEVVFALRLGGYHVPESLASSVRLMASYLPTVTHPDGEIAQFNDSARGEAPRPAQLDAAGYAALNEPRCAQLSVRHALMSAAVTIPPRFRPSSVARTSTEDGGVVRVPALDGRGVLLMDVGRACPDELPAHAHADFFSFELSIGRRRVIVDAGVGEYARGPWRDYDRSTRAHNTLSVDDSDQIECWDSFRVARRGNVFDRVVVNGPFLNGISAWHDGYGRLADPVHVGRTLVALDDRAWLVIDDLRGTGDHTWESCLHAAPDVEVVRVGPDQACLTLDGQRLGLAWFGVQSVRMIQGQMSPLQGWHAAEFGRRVPVSVLTLKGHGAVPIRTGYVLAPDFDPGEVLITSSDEGVAVRLGAAQYLVRGSAGEMLVSRHSE